MRGLLKRTVRTAMAMELVDLAVQAVDGTKVAANASSCRSYDAKGLAKLLERLDRAIAGLEDQNEGETGRAPVHLPGPGASPGPRCISRAPVHLPGPGASPGPRCISRRNWPARGTCATRCAGRWRSWGIEKAKRVST